ncbi:MAG: transposase [Lewinellaceae bacterium]|nr:transposase [Lewinellaceae bacterium]MCB9320201.1 transposase [Lewinellaceae bacterium]
MEVVKLKYSKGYRRYSESFKLHVLHELRTGKYNKNELAHKYGIAAGSLLNWINKYEQPDLLNRRIRIEMPEDLNRIKELEAKVKELEKALVKTQLDYLYHAGLNEYAAQRLGYANSDELAKKRDAKESKKQ